MPRYKPHSEAELLDFLTNSDDDDFIKHEDEGDGWNDSPDDADIKSEKEFDVGGNESIWESYDDDDQRSDNDSNGPPSPKKARVDDIFKWTKGNFHPNVYNFNNEGSGCKIHKLGDSPSPLEIFEHFMPREFVEEIVKQTNSYYQYTIRNAAENTVKNYRPTDVNEMYTFFGLCLLMPLTKKHRLQDYWTKDFIIETPIFSQVMSRDRYFQLLRYLHFCDNDNMDKNDRLCKIRCVVDHFKNSFQHSLYPFQNIVIDESLQSFSDQVSFRQYIPSKRHKFGIKFFVIVDCETGYILDFIIYTGSTTEIKDFHEQFGKSGNIVLSLTENYWNKGHRLYTDNWYTSPLLYRFLYGKKINCCGTANANRKFMPAFDDQKAERGTVQDFCTNDLLAIKWTDKRDVHMLTSFHENAMNASGLQRESQEKPVCFADYNSNMRVVECIDTFLSLIESVRKTIKWYKKIFFHLLDWCILNSHAVYKQKTGANLPLLVFHKRIVHEMLEKYNKCKPRSSSGRRPNKGHSPLRLTERHFPSMYPRKLENKKVIQKRCVVCSKRKIRKETSYTCKQCDVPLCVIGCFERYHTEVDF